MTRWQIIVFCKCSCKYQCKICIRHLGPLTVLKILLHGAVREGWGGGGGHQLLTETELLTRTMSDLRHQTNESMH